MSLYFCTFYLGLLTTDFALSGQRQVPFFKPHLVTVTDIRLTSWKYMINIFPKDIMLWGGQDSNPGPSTPSPDALTTRPQRSPVIDIPIIMHCLSDEIFGIHWALETHINRNLYTLRLFIAKKRGYVQKLVNFSDIIC